MEFVIGFLAAIGSFLAGVLGHILAHDFCECTPKICLRIIEYAVKLLPEADRARYREEWRSDLNERPGVLAKFEHACGCIRGAHRLRKQRSILRPTFRVLRIEFQG